MEAEESIERHTAGDYWWFNTQKRGNFFFTKEKMIFISGFGMEKFAIKYKDIAGLKKCCVGPFIPTGIKVIVQDENGKQKKYKCSVLKRKEWIAYLQEKSGITVA